MPHLTASLWKDWPGTSVRVILRCDANAMLADTRPQTRRNRKRIHWNTLGDFFESSTTQMPGNRLPQ